MGIKTHLINSNSKSICSVSRYFINQYLLLRVMAWGLTMKFIFYGKKPHTTLNLPYGGIIINII